jgi:ABC-type uncharacterized transport system substrate-binding protein
MIERRPALAVTLALALLATPLAAGTQQAEKVYRIGYLGGGMHATAPHLVEAFRQGLREHGWVEGRNIIIEYRSQEGKAERLPEVAAELVRLNVDVIVATNPPWIWAVKDATKTIPIVMVFGPDPVESGLVRSLARPGGNITGLTSLSADLSAKQLDLLKEIVPGVSLVALLWNPTNPWHTLALKSIETTAQYRGVRLQALGVRGPDEFNAAFLSMTKDRAGALLVLADPVTAEHRARVAELAVKHRLPAVCALREFAEAGCLASYWPNSPASFRRAAAYVHRILNGARPGDLPIEQPTTFELVLNAKTAKALGLTIPPPVLLRADQVIQ